MRLRSPLVALLASMVVLAACRSSDSGPQESAATVPAAGAAARASGAAGGTPAADSAFLATADANRIQGSPAASVWLLVISDFQCPFCRLWHEQTYDALVREYVQPGRIRMAYINLPLSNHANAGPAAEAAMCAGVQGKFWPMHDQIFRSQERWTPLPDAVPTYDALATGLGLDMAAWRSCMSGRRTAPMVAADASRAGQIGVRSTPTFIVMQGQQPMKAIAGAFPIDTFRVALDRALAGARP